jgi:hypothetical protein
MILCPLVNNPVSHLQHSNVNSVFREVIGRDFDYRNGRATRMPVSELKR